MTMGEQAEQPRQEQAAELFHGLALPAAEDLSPEAFSRNNFFNPGAAAASSANRFKHITSSTPESVLLTKVITTVHPEMPADTLYEYAEEKAQEFYLWRAAWMADGEWSHHLQAIENEVPPSAEIRTMFGAAREFLDSRYGSIYENLFTRTEQLGLFLVTIHEDPEPEVGDRMSSTR